MERIIGESKRYIKMLQINPCEYCRRIILFKLGRNMTELGNICSVMNEERSARTYIRQKTFTLDELSQYTGKNGNAAYVAVNGTVYDVTNNAAWAAGTHFGLSAGRDLSGAFSSCHVSPSILEKLVVVGKLI